MRGRDWLEDRGRLLTVTMISDWLFTSSLRQESAIQAFK